MSSYCGMVLRSYLAGLRFGTRSKFPDSFLSAKNSFALLPRSCTAPVYTSTTCASAAACRVAADNVNGRKVAHASKGDNLRFNGIPLSGSEFRPNQGRYNAFAAEPRRSYAVAPILLSGVCVVAYRSIPADLTAKMNGVDGCQRTGLAGPRSWGACYRYSAAILSFQPRGDRAARLSFVAPRRKPVSVSEVLLESG